MGHDMALPLEISERETLELVQGGNPPLIVDVRDANSYAAGHIPGAISVPMDGFDLRKIAAKAAPDAQIIVSCYMGHASKSVVDYLRQNGYANAQSMAGGWSGWQRMPGAPVEK